MDCWHWLSTESKAHRLKGFASTTILARPLSLTESGVNAWHVYAPSKTLNKGHIDASPTPVRATS